MLQFEEFEQCLRTALTHLYDPAYQPPELLGRVLGGPLSPGVQAVRNTILAAIEAFKPTAATPPTARARRFYQLLHDRYVQELTQEETAQRLCITPRHLRREQQDAVEALAHWFWDRYRAQAPVENQSNQEQSTPSAASSTASAWRSQVQQELAALQASAPGMVADVEEVIRGVTIVGRSLAAGHGVQLALGAITPSLVAAVHPSVLRQLLLTAIEKLVQNMTAGHIVLGAEPQREGILFHVTGYPVASEQSLVSAFMQETVAAQRGVVRLHTDQQRTSFLIELPRTKHVTVLVVDDNADLVHFYQRYTMGTRYRIVHAAEAAHSFALIQSLAPALIVLDVMLPDIDGWELLTQLHEHQATRSIPVIVCSVVRREELALTLGAALYVPKPVGRQDFIRALDQVCARLPIGA